MNSTLESYPFLKHRLNKYILPISSELGSTNADSRMAEKLIIDNSTINITITEPLITLVKNACDIVEKAKGSGENKDIEKADKALSLIYDSYCQEELEYELNNLKKALQLPELIAELEELLERNHDENEILAKASKGIQEAVGLLKYYPEVELKSELKSRLDELKVNLKSIYTFQDIDEMITKLKEEVHVLERNAYQTESFLNGLYGFRGVYKSVSSILNQSLLNRQEKKELMAKMKDISQINTALDQQLVSILNDHIDASLVPPILRLINEKEFSDLTGSTEYGAYFVQNNNDKVLDDLSAWKQAITETAGMYLIIHAANPEQLNRGILYFEYIPYINLGQERIEVCEQFFNKNKAELCTYRLFEEIAAAIQPLIDERTNKVKRINEAETPEEMFGITMEAFGDINSLDINEMSAKYVWLRKERRAYRSLNSIVNDIVLADNRKLEEEQINHSNAIEVNVNDDQYHFICKSKNSSDTLNLM